MSARPPASLPIPFRRLGGAFGHPSGSRRRQTRRPILLPRFGWLRCLFVDGGEAGELAAWCRKLLPRRGLRLEVVKRRDADKHRFKLLPRRWVVERTFGWLSKFRRLSKDCEFRTENSEAIILIAAARLMLARLA